MKTFLKKISLLLLFFCCSELMYSQCVNPSVNIDAGNTQGFCAPTEINLPVIWPETNNPNTEYIFILHDLQEPYTLTDTLSYFHNENLPETISFSFETSSCNASGSGYKIDIYIKDVTCEDGAFNTPSGQLITSIFPITIDGLPKASFTYEDTGCSVYTLTNSSIAGEQVEDLTCSDNPASVNWIIDADPSQYQVLDGSLGENELPGSDQVIIQFNEPDIYDVILQAQTCGIDRDSISIVINELGLGCTDPLALNYSSCAFTDDGSCVWNTQGCVDEGMIELTINMSDSYGDGWNGSNLVINGDSVTLNSGSSGSEILCFDSTEGCNEVIVSEGTWPSEVSWSISDQDGNLLLFGGAPYAGEFCGQPEPICSDSLVELLITMNDSYGDGWNGNVLNINGNSFTIETGYQGSDYTCYDPLGCLDISCDGGSWQQEVSWTISDVDGNELFNGGAPYEGPSSVIIEVSEGLWPSEVSWTISDVDGNELFNGDVGTTSACLESGCLTFSMYDSYGDGWNGSEVTITSEDGELLLTGTLESGSEGDLFLAFNDICGSSNQAEASTLFNGVQNIDVLTFNGLNYLNDIDRNIKTKYIAENNDTVLYQNSSSEWNENHFIYGLNISNYYCSYSWCGSEDDIYYRVANSSGSNIYKSNTFYDNNSPKVYNQHYTEINGNSYQIKFYDYDAANNDDLLLTYPINSTTSDNLNINYGGNSALDYMNFELHRSNNNPHLDVHWGTSKAYDYFYNTFGRNGFNDNNGEIVNIFNVSYFSSSKYYDSNSNIGYIDYTDDVMNFNSNSWANPDVGIDNVGNNFADLIALSISANRDGEYGALATSFGNIFGVCIEKYVKPNEWNWIIGEHAMLPVLEYPNIDITDEYSISLSDPALSNTPQATYYQGDGWDTDGNININSGIQNLWFHNLSVGGWFLNNESQLTVFEGIGIDSAAIILYNNFIQLPDTATYYDAFINSMFVCDSIFGPQSNQKNQMMLAWESVGLYQIFGCTDPIAFNFDDLANTDNGTCVEVVYGCTDPIALNFDDLANTDNGTCEDVIAGCTNPNAFNFDNLANIDNGTCEEIVYGCTDPNAFNFNDLANIDNGTCEEIVYGCTDPNAFNFNDSANTNNGICIPIIEGCTIPEALNFDQNANTNNGNCVFEILGCTDPDAFNYDANANTDNGSCEDVIAGCMDPNAFNFNDLANIDDGSCIEIVYGCTDPSAFNFDITANTDNGTCEDVIAGCTDPNAFNFDITANIDDGSCIEIVYGCTDSNAFNFNDLANTNNGTCEDIIFGCTENDAFNYNPDANTNDNSCVPYVLGCTDSSAANYNTAATADNGSCTYYPNCQNITLPYGWSMFSSYIVTENMDIANNLSTIVDNVIITKNNSGQAYMVEFDFNGIGDMIVGQGYQIKTLFNSAFDICGMYAKPEENIIELSAGWNMIGYLRIEPEQADIILQEINSSGNLIIAKDFMGSAYLPEFNFNGIGEMREGLGYQIKVFNEDILQY